MIQPLPIHITKSLFEPAATRRYEGVVPPFALSLGADEYAFDEPSSWQADVTNTGGALLVSGTVDAQVRCSCARCLEDATYDLTGEIEGFFLIPGEEAEVDDLEEDEFDTLPDDEMIDMAPLIQSALVLELPRVPLCREDCAGLCPTCGKNLNEGPCACEPADDATPAGPFAALADLKLD